MEVSTAMVADSVDLMMVATSSLLPAKRCALGTLMSCKVGFATFNDFCARNASEGFVLLVLVTIGMNSES